jgi:hypothetical protein
VTCDSKPLVKTGLILVDDINTRNLSEHLDQDCQKDPLPLARLSEEFCKLCLTLFSNRIWSRICANSAWKKDSLPILPRRRLRTLYASSSRSFSRSQREQYGSQKVPIKTISAGRHSGIVLERKRVLYRRERTEG